MTAAQALYGLRESPKLWRNTLKQHLQNLSLSPVPEEPCIFLNRYIIVFFFVDDIAIIFHKKHQRKFEEFKIQLMSQIEMRYIGELKWFLGISVTRNRNERKIALNQSSYIAKIAARFGVDKCSRQHSTPLPPHEVFTLN
ncbi:Retrovirus-related Pol polyprotein from transposon TNT 1-94, partial [Golovinomyces cichoracearum]